MIRCETSHKEFLVVSVYAPDVRMIFIRHTRERVMPQPDGKGFRKASRRQPFRFRLMYASADYKERCRQTAVFKIVITNES